MSSLTRSKIPVADRFWKKVQKTDTCWLWTAGKDKCGYGQFMNAEKVCNQAHRFSWAIYNGDIPTGMCILHSCDRPECVNPDHLKLGTYQENMKERDRKKRNAWGEKMGNSRLTEEKVLEIRASSNSYWSLSKVYGVSQTTIRAAKLGLTWSRLSVQESVNENFIESKKED